MKKSNANVAGAVSKPATTRVASSKKVDSRPSFAARLVVDADSVDVHLALHVVNSSSKRVEVNFPTGQTYDFVILDSIGREMWHWGSGRMFTQTLRNKLVDGGESLDMHETWKRASLAPGRYTARGVLTSENYPISQTTKFTVGEATSVAARDNP